MNDLSNFIGGCLFGGIFVGIVVLALATAYWLYVRKDTGNSNEQQKPKHIKDNKSGIRFNDGLDIDSWLYR